MKTAGEEEEEEEAPCFFLFNPWSLLFKAEREG